MGILLEITKTTLDYFGVPCHHMNLVGFNTLEMVGPWIRANDPRIFWNQKTFASKAGESAPNFYEENE